MNNTRFDRINDEAKAEAQKKTPRRKPAPKPVEVAAPDNRTVREKIDAGVYSAEKVMPYPGFKSKDPANKEERRKYYEIEAQLMSQFKQDLIAEHYATGWPKVDLCYEKAWEHGHSAGLHEVVTYFEDLVELLSPPV